jgi:hypothetical protein
MRCMRRAAPSLLLVLVFLVAPFLQAGCTDPENVFELGPLFAPATPPPGQARIYVYWPAPRQASRGVYHLETPGSVEQLLPGGYLPRSSVPGMTTFRIGRVWQAGSIWRSWPLLSMSTGSMAGPKLAFLVEEGQVYYLRIAPRPGLVDQLALELVASQTGQAEIKRCHLLQSKSALFGRTRSGR